MSGHPANMENVRNAYNILGIQHEMKRPFGKAMHKWRKNIKKVFKEIKRMDWIQLVHDRFQWWDLMNMVLKLLSSIKWGNFLIK
jgi:methionine synthase II (cobalamin-independent)